MGQIVKRKKKGRPSKADLGARDPPQTERDLRRSHRRRSVKYVFELDDYFDEDEVFVDDEDQRRREKKLKHLLKLQESGGPESTSPSDRRVQHAPESESSSDDGGKPSKKRKIDEEMDEDVYEENDDANEEENYNDEDEEEVREAKHELKADDSAPETPAEARCGLPLPDKKVLELILDKLQRKDIYGVYAEPVDPEELPDYHDVIQNPMDFATVRNNLRNGLYATFEQFESDIFLICSNAMQYNSSDTVYHKQARTIQELAKRKFLKIRLNIDKEIKSEQKAKSGSIPKKLIKRPVSRTGQEPVGSDFSSGATLATVGDIQNVASALQAVGSEKAGGVDGLFEGSSFMNDNNLDKAEDSLPGRGPPSRFGRRSSIIQDENPRATYNISLSQPVANSESIFSTFDEETKQLMPVGLYSDHSYARSLARFAATLGSAVWQVASKRIEHALPQGFKFGQGWVGEYEPLPTPVLILENCSVKEPPFFTKAQPAASPRNFEKVPVISKTSKERQGNLPFFEQKLPFLGPAGIRSPAPIISTQPIRGSMSETKPPFFLSPGIRPSSSHNLSYINQNLQSRDLLESDQKAQKQVELNSPRTLSKNAADSVGYRQFSRSSEVEASRSMEFSSKNNNFSQSGSLKQPDRSNGVAFGGLTNGKVVGNNVDANKVPSSSADLMKPASFHTHEQGQHRKPASYNPHEQGQQMKPSSYHRHEQGQQTKPASSNPHEQGQQRIPASYHPHEQGQQMKPSSYHPQEQGQQMKPASYHPHEQGQQRKPGSYHPHEQGQQTKLASYHLQEQGQQRKQASYHPQEQGQQTKLASYPPQEQGQQTKPGSYHLHEQGQQRKPASYHPQEQGQQTKQASYPTHEQGQQTKPASYYPHEQGQQTKSASYHPHEQDQQTKQASYHPHEQGQQTKPASYRHPHEQDQQTKPASYHHPHEQVQLTKLDSYHPHEQSQQMKPASYHPHEQGQLTKQASYHPHEQGQPANYHPREQGQGLSDPVQLMRKLSDLNQQKSSNQSSADTSQDPTSGPSLTSNDPNNAAMAAARAWMSVGAQGLRPLTENANPNKNHMYGDPVYNPSRNIPSQVSQIRGEFPSTGMHIRPDKNNAPMHAFVPQGAIPMLVGNQIQFQNQRMVFPQLAPADLSRFQLQSSWNNVSPQMHSKQKQESLPPDLNIGFQSSGSPGRSSSGVLVDSQHPDLALQL